MSRNRSKLAALKRDIAEAYGRMAMLENHIGLGTNLLDDEPPQQRPRRNGIFTDAVGYGVKRVVARKSRKQLEKAVAKDAIARTRLEAARKKAAQ